MRVFSLLIITTYPDISLQTELTRHIIYSVHDMSGAICVPVTCYQRSYTRELSLLRLNVTHSFASSRFSSSVF